MTPTKPSELTKLEWKPCTKDSVDKGHIYVYHPALNQPWKKTCPHCNGTGLEPVAVENPLCDWHEDCIKLSPKHYQLQLGKVFEVEIGESIIVGKPVKREPMIMKFLPIRPFSPSGHSKMWVVRCG